MKKFILVISIFFIIIIPTAVFGISWPATGIISENTITLPSPYEPSGLAWNEVTRKLFVVSDPTSDNHRNRITMMNIDGSDQVTWKMNGDFEALTIVNPNSNYIYVGVENLPAIKEFDLTSPIGSPQITKTWRLDRWLGNLGNKGIEGLAYIPDGFHPYANEAQHSVFYVGLQRRPDLNHSTATEYDDGLIYAFDVNLNVSGDVEYLGYLDLDYSQMTVYNYNISDLFFNEDTGTLFVLYDDDSNRLFELTSDGKIVLHRYDNVPGSAREGFVIIPDEVNDRSIAFVAHDNNREVNWHYGFLQTFFQDQDNDGLGSYNTTTTTSLIPPEGYVNNYLDENDNDFDNDGFEIGEDCNDHDDAIFGPEIYYMDNDRDGLGFGLPYQLCSPSEGFVLNVDDKNDNDFDNDGFETEEDCDDTNWRVAQISRYYRDADGDGLGWYPIYIDGCFWRRPIGYVSNHRDRNDNDYDNDGISPPADPDDKNPKVFYWSRRLGIRWSNYR